MNETEITDEKEEFDKLLQKGDMQAYLLRLYIAGMTDKSARAVQNIRKICDENLNGRYELEVIDIYQQPELARDAQIIAAPMLVKKLPPPLRRLIGDMTDKERILVGLDLRPK
ncbi:MAG TPA: circadian clock KaiB family protein [Candidatus Methanoperedens sp.]|nr:circadian clock KaiB family protein [Candidatus Methanoperedens sp.]